MIAELRTALVTGASSGIGRAIALRLRHEGMRVIAVGRNVAALAKLEADCGIEPLAIDVRDVANFAAVFGENAVDVLVNNAGVLSTRVAFQDAEPADIDQMIDVNLKAPLQLTRLALAPMVARRRGHLFFIGSIAGRWPHANMAAYGTSKAGISLFVDALRADLVGTGVRVTEIAPGRVETQLYRTVLGPEAAKASLYEEFDCIQPSDIAELISVALRLPERVDVSRMEVFPTSQTLAGSRMAKASKVASE